MSCFRIETLYENYLFLKGKDLGVQEYGYYALNTLRLEKSFGIWNSEFMQAYTPGETGLNRWISRGKNVDFVGKTSALKELSAGKKALAKNFDYPRNKRCRGGGNWV